MIADWPLFDYHKTARMPSQWKDSNAFFGIKGTIGTFNLSNCASKSKYFLKITLFYLYSACILFC